MAIPKITIVLDQLGKMALSIDKINKDLDLAIKERDRLHVLVGPYERGETDNSSHYAEWQVAARKSDELATAFHTSVRDFKQAAEIYISEQLIKVGLPTEAEALKYNRIIAGPW